MRRRRTEEAQSPQVSALSATSLEVRGRRGYGGLSEDHHETPHVRERGRIQPSKHYLTEREFRSRGKCTRDLYHNAYHNRAGFRGLWGLAQAVKTKSPTNWGFRGAAGPGFEPGLTDPELAQVHSSLICCVRKLCCLQVFCGIHHDNLSVMYRPVLARLQYGCSTVGVSIRVG